MKPKLFLIILFCVILTACGKKSSPQEDPTTTETIQPDTVTEANATESELETPNTSTSSADTTAENHDDFLPDDWYTISEGGALRQITISKEETVAWNAIPYDVVVSIKEQLLETSDETIPIYLPITDDDIARIDINLTLADTFLDALADKPDHYIRVGRNLPQGTMVEEYNVSDTDNICVLMYMEDYEVERYTRMMDAVATESEESETYGLTIKPVPLCPRNSHDNLLCHTATITLTNGDLESAHEVLAKDPDGVIVMQYTITKGAEEYL